MNISIMTWKGNMRNITARDEDKCVVPERILDGVPGEKSTGLDADREQR
jgi:hypothetical protein